MLKAHLQMYLKNILNESKAFAVINNTYIYLTEL